MKTLYQTPETSPSELKEDAPYSYPDLAKALGPFQTKLPPIAVAAIEAVLKAVSAGLPFSINILEQELSTQEAANMLQCSRPYLVKLLEEGAIPHTKVGSHRRVKRKDLQAYEMQERLRQQALLVELTNMDYEDGLYDA